MTEFLVMAYFRPCLHELKNFYVVNFDDFMICNLDGPRNFV